MSRHAKPTKFLESLKNTKTVEHTHTHTHTLQVLSPSHTRTHSLTLIKPFHFASQPPAPPTPSGP